MAVAVKEKVKPETIEGKQARTLKEVAYKFRDESELTEAQLTDPDYRLKELNAQGAKVCSKCHHCRR